VGLIVFLIGLVLALQSAYQLRRFGASIYMADLLAISLTREMGPLMTAIIVAGRSGASIAAEIATMQVSEEIDALRTMGLNPVRYVVVPKFQAITVTVPALTIYANVLGIFGGLVVAVLYLDIGATAFLGQVFDALVVKDVVTGLVKSLAFAWIIVLIAAHRGFAARGGAESVGLVTTASVVSSIFWVIVADAGFSLLFYFGG
jgi:phospholipid/cholesterol/gamma-HCH transport system permease protein